MPRAKVHKPLPQHHVQAVLPNDLPRLEQALLKAAKDYIIAIQDNRGANVSTEYHKAVLDTRVEFNRVGAVWFEVAKERNELISLG